MLVLGVKVGSRVMVGDCVLTVIETSPGRVRLGFEAPDSIKIWREKNEKRQGNGSPNKKAKD